MIPNIVLYFVIYNTVFHYLCKKPNSVNHNRELHLQRFKHCVYPHTTKLFAILNFQENTYTEHLTL